MIISIIVYTYLTFLKLHYIMPSHLICSLLVNQAHHRYSDNQPSNAIESFEQFHVAPWSIIFITHCVS
jgi:hypothetical protein